LRSIWSILYQRKCFPDIVSLKSIFCFFFIVASVCTFLTCCDSQPFTSPKALLNTFCSAYNTKNDELLYECGLIDYVLEQIAVEKLDPSGDIYYVRAKGLQFKIIDIHEGRIGIQREISKDRILVKVRFYSDVELEYEKVVTIYMTKKKSTTNSPSRWQINLIPS